MKTIVKILLWIIVLFGFATTCYIACSPSIAPAQEVNQVEVKYPQAIVEVWTMPGCSPCEWVKANAVPQWKKSARVSVIDYTRWGTAAQRKGITAYPTIIVYSAEKKEVYRTTSGRPYSGDALTRAIQSEINKVNKATLDDKPKPNKPPQTPAVERIGVDAVISQDREYKVIDGVTSATNAIGFIPPEKPVNECSSDACRLGNIFGWSDDDSGEADDAPIDDESDDGAIKRQEPNPLPGGNRKLEGNGIDGTHLDSIVGPIVEKSTAGVKERLDELLTEVKSSVMRAAIIGSLLAMVIYSVMRTAFSWTFALMKSVVIKIRNWICSSIASIATKVADKVADKVSADKATK